MGEGSKAEVEACYGTSSSCKWNWSAQEGEIGFLEPEIEAESVRRRSPKWIAPCRPDVHQYHSAIAKIVLQYRRPIGKSKGSSCRGALLLPVNELCVFSHTGVLQPGWMSVIYLSYDAFLCCVAGYLCNHMASTSLLKNICDVRDMRRQISSGGQEFVCAVSTM
jgi:hypothetical protein